MIPALSGCSLRSRCGKREQEESSADYADLKFQHCGGPRQGQGCGICKRLSDVFVAASVSLHGARPWHPQNLYAAFFGILKSKFQRRKAVESEKLLRGFFCNLREKVARGKAG